MPRPTLPLMERLPAARQHLLGVLCLVALTSATAAAAAAPASAGIVGEPQEATVAPAMPWELLPLPGGRTVASERDAPGRIRVVEGPGSGTVLFTGPPGTSKFLGLVAHPEYAANRLVYLYLTYDAGGGVLRNRIVRLVDEGPRWTLQRIVFDGIDSDGGHDGGRMAFGPDRRLYVTTGDVHRPDRPQDLQSLNGKILRLAAPGTDADGSAPADNPFVAQGAAARFVWSSGHRNPQGLAFDRGGRLYESEHGPSLEPYGPAYPGGNRRCCRDELNLIERGGNYGWPLISGDEADPARGLRAPIATSGPGSTWAPGGLVAGTDGQLYMPALAGQHLREFTLTADCRGVASQVAHFQGRFGRLRAAAVDARGLLFAQDAAPARVLRVGLGAAGSTCPALPASPPPQEPDAAPSDPAPPGQPTPDPAPPGGAVPGLPAPSPVSGAPVRSDAPASRPATLERSRSVTALRRLVARGAADLRRRGVSGVRRTGSLRTYAGGLAPGRLLVRLERLSGRPRTLASASTTVRGPGTVVLRVRLGATGRRVWMNNS